MTELFAQTLRERYDAALPDVAVDPAPIVRRGRRRRRVRQVGGGLAVVAAIAALVVTVSLTSSGPRHPPTTPPPPEEPSDYSLWLSAGQVPPGDVELVAVLVNHTGVEATFGVYAELDRWDGDSWEAYRHAGMCLDHWHCTARFQDLAGDLAVEDIGLGATVDQPGPVERFTVAGLDPGWYRLTQSAYEGPVAAGVFEVVEGATAPAPLWPLDVPAISVQPAVLPTDGGAVTLTPLIPVGEDGSQTAEDIAAAVEGLAETATVERWDGAGWAAVGTSLPLASDDPSGAATERAATVTPLEPGEYRLVRTGPGGDHIGRFWVIDASGSVVRDAVVLDEYPGVPDGAELLGDEGTVLEVDGDRVLVSTRGTGDCAIVPVGTETEGDRLTVVLRSPARECAGDLPYTTYVLAMPDDYTPSASGPVPGTRDEASAEPVYVALRAWLAELVDAAGYPRLGGSADRLNANDAVWLDELVGIVVEPREAAPTQGEVRPERTADVGGLRVTHGTVDDQIPAAQFTCGGFRFGFAGRNPTGEAVADVATVAEAVAAQITSCPADEAELLERYADAVG